MYKYTLKRKTIYTEAFSEYENAINKQEVNQIVRMTNQDDIDWLKIEQIALRKKTIEKTHIANNLYCFDIKLFTNNNYFYLMLLFVDIEEAFL